MAYVGQPPQIGQYRKMDDISASFDSSQTAFPITVGGTAFNPPTAFAMMVSLGNVILNPGVAFSITGSTINFNTPPAASTAFFGLIFGDTLYTGTPSDDTVTTSKIADGAVTYDKFSTTTQARLTAGQIIFGV